MSKVGKASHHEQVLTEELLQIFIFVSKELGTWNLVPNYEQYPKTKISTIMEILNAISFFFFFLVKWNNSKMLAEKIIRTDQKKKKDENQEMKCRRIN